MNTQSSTSSRTVLSTPDEGNRRTIVFRRGLLVGVAAAVLAFGNPAGVNAASPQANHTSPRIATQVVFGTVSIDGLTIAYREAGPGA